ncbi:hydantoinase/oxoprolinase family protein [Algiphilus sp.]|uniref:hydantoinase/oxoprolinase family protein n=1 Tax=Algiphilus sp. TaxID=1872431 RepID=UPI0025B8CD14|nr:hydantoinase/oxoprolinase family protein [Algiphilus sp.]MCK5771180.1 hydantoinase/oxoprolinase family protein [Algiphilus sp.]
MGLLVSIDNGGTLTDVCATDGARTVHAKTLTTPHDLTECFVKCLESLSEKLYGEVDLPRLVTAADYIRYSTTQGTNAVVQRKGPSLGWIVDDAALIERVASAAPELHETFIGDRARVVPVDSDEAAYRSALIRATAELVSAGANRIVIGFAGDHPADAEKAAKRILYRAFPRHLLGAVPMLFATELSKLGTDVQRIWAALLNSFLHPAMEGFLYNAENKLREHRARKPLLIFANDGNSTRVAKTIAIKTYSSGPQGGVVGGEVLLGHYGRSSAVSIDIGGTTTDVALFKQGRAEVQPSGEIAGAPVPIPLAEMKSIGAGGGSIIRAVEGRIAVGPESVGSAPGPACFGRGGTEATITDALLLQGILDPESYFGGRLKLDRDRAEAAVMRNVAEPLGLSLDEALDAMSDAYHRKVADALPTGGDTVELLMAFGGAGPMSACGVAELAGIDEILVPRYAAVFCAYGITFSDIQHSYVGRVGGGSEADLAQVREALDEQARRGMLAEGFPIESCTRDYHLLERDGDAYHRSELNGATAVNGAESWVELRATRQIDKIALPAGATEETRQAEPDGVRKGRQTLPLYRLESLQPGDWADGPCLVEEAFFTAHVRPGWRFVVSPAGDAFMRRQTR